jgi:hypothetical protein
MGNRLEHHGCALNAYSKIKLETIATLEIRRHNDTTGKQQKDLAAKEYRVRIYQSEFRRLFLHQQTNYFVTT